MTGSRVSADEAIPAQTHTLDTNRFSAREWLGVVIGFTLLTLALTYPQFLYLGSRLGEHYDSLFSTWRLAWIAHQLPRHPMHLFDANIFFPEPNTLSYSDAILLPGVLGAPLVWMGLHPVVEYNLLVLISFVACGVSMYFLVRTETQSIPAAWFAGAVFAFQQYRFAHYPHLELLWGWPIPLAFWALTRVLHRRRARDGAILGAIIVLQLLSCLYYSVFLVTALLILTIVRLVGRPWSECRALAKPALTAVLVCMAVAGPYAMPYLNQNRPTGTRAVEDVRQWSAPLRSYLTTPVQHWLLGRLIDPNPNMEHVLFPGIVAAGFAVAGALDRRRQYLAYVVLLLVAIDLSLGFNGLTYRALYGVMWPFHDLRVPARMFVIVSAVLAVLGGNGVACLLRRIGRPLPRQVVPALLVLLVLLESVSTPMALSEVASEPPPVYRWLKAQPPAVVMEWPLPRASALHLTQAPLYMYYSTFHWQRLVNGYSGLYPESYITLIETAANFPTRESVRYLERLGVRFVILHREPAPARYDAVKARLSSYGQFELLFVSPEKESEATVYRLGPAAYDSSADR